MTFYASNARIKVTDGTDTIFDTDDNMPHIIGTSNIQDVEVAYPNVASTQVYHYTGSFAYFYCPPAYLEIVTVTPPCETTYSYAYVCDPPLFCYDPMFCFPYCYGQFNITYYCPPTYYTYNYVVPPCEAKTDYFDVTQAQYAATEYAATQELASYPKDEDGNYVPIDFVIVQASGSRTTAGTDPIIRESILTTVPPNTFSFQGSILLESAGLADGKTYLRRILSVVLNNTTKRVLLNKQASTRLVDTGQPNEDSMASTFKFNFKIFFGKFKS